ncbi:TauD/TfdA family dioxygenase [Tropicimonas sp. IMCC6043]|uniref:TauD/TfdA family dioxygenase n=1 Tax=Tropicimonas sp. IMCC6043 TaxID=2510645 RepID=UPI00101D7B6F|nr:TauD/TfdA family dioxygenase [Tropicimonas sp. IMCC6043]RYH12225.1 taurine catabolism dioxygenase TauD [Tropicimonas sp. IMCC6043]
MRVSERLQALPPVEVDSLESPSPEAVRELEARCALGNFAVYSVAHPETDVAAASAALARFAQHFGLLESEAHRSSGAAGVVALRTSSEEGKKGYIPYTPKAMNWHTDGYYSAPENRVAGFLLHCHQKALSGGENQLMDPELAYLRLREADPAYVRALMHPEAMTIPENREPDGTIRPDSVGPVFYPDPATGRLQMRYTARTRSINWRQDSATLEAADWLRAWLAAGDPLMRQIRLDRGQGILNNNVLHNRTRFEDGASETDRRVMLRLRFHVRVAEEIHGAAE